MLKTASVSEGVFDLTFYSTKFYFFSFYFTKSNQCAQRIKFKVEFTVAIMYRFKLIVFRGLEKTQKYTSVFGY